MDVETLFKLADKGVTGLAFYLIWLFVTGKIVAGKLLDLERERADRERTINQQYRAALDKSHRMATIATELVNDAYREKEDL